MGSASSCPNKPDVKTYNDKKLSRKSQFLSVDRFVQLVLQQFPLEVTIKAIVNNSIAFTTFVDFLATQIICGQNTSEFISITNITSLLFDTIGNTFRNCLQNAYSCSSVTVDKQSPDSRLFSLSCQMFPAYVKSQSFNNWRLKEISGNFVLFGNKIPPECTLPELETIHSFSKKSSLVLGNAEISDPSMKTALILSNENSSKIPNSPNLPIGFLLTEYENTSISSDSTKYSSDESPTVLKRKSPSETLPIGITLSSISSKRPCYPVIYLNKHFADNCGHNRDDILGERFGFMQRPGSKIFPHSEYDVMNVTKALKTGQNIVSRIDITRHDKIYTTVIVTKHIFDSCQKSKFVIGLQVEVQSNFQVRKYMTLLQKLIHSLPSSTC
eukprot:gene404-734_t